MITQEKGKTKQQPNYSPPKIKENKPRHRADEQQLLATAAAAAATKCHNLSSFSLNKADARPSPATKRKKRRKKERKKR